MQKSKHIQGPWSVRETPESSHQDYVVRAGNNGIASLFYQPDGSNEANAHLIAAAPDMYEALKAVQLFHYGCNWHHENDCSLSCGGHVCDCGCDVVKEAIRKAESE